MPFKVYSMEKTTQNRKMPKARQASKIKGKGHFNTIKEEDLKRKEIHTSEMNVSSEGLFFHTKNPCIYLCFKSVMDVFFKRTSQSYPKGVLGEILKHSNMLVLGFIFTF